MSSLALAGTDRPVILVYGDSLSAAYGMKPEQGWASLLQGRLEREGHRYHVVNASVSGETSAGGLTRLPHALRQHRPAIVLLELGANDGLRGLSLEATQANLARMLDLIQAQPAQVILIGIHLPPNYGPAYTRRFHEIYRTLAARHRIALLPFLLEGVALDERLMQDDGLHPTAEAQAAILDNVWQTLAPLLGR